jgi:hypothetical protein
LNLLSEFPNFSSLLSKILKSNRLSILSFFSIGLLLRAIPDIIIQQYPVGYETITYYAPAINTFPDKTLLDVFMENFHAGPILYVGLWCAYAITGTNSFLLLKVVGSILFGCLISSFFWFLKKGMKLNWKIAGVATWILTFQVATLRQGWDRLRNVLALVFMFLALTILCQDDTKFKWIWIGGLSILAVLSREYIVIPLFVGILGCSFFAKQTNRWDRLKSILVLIPALSIFTITINLSDVQWSYFSDGSNALGNYLYAIQDASIIFVLCYLPLFPLILKGLKRHRLLDSLVIFFILVSFSVIIPWFAIPGYQRWIMLLAFPFSIYAAYGYEKISKKPNLIKSTTVLLLYLAIGLGYVSGTFPYGGLLPNSYVPVNLTQSSIPWNQIDNVKEVLQWFDENALTDSSILTEERFYGWTQIYSKRINEDLSIEMYAAESPPWKALDKALSKNAQQVYLIWFNDSEFEEFRRIYSHNDVAIFQYEL